MATCLATKLCPLLYEFNQGARARARFQSMQAGHDHPRALVYPEDPFQTNQTDRLLCLKMTGVLAWDCIRQLRREFILD
jgi:hypothetical protein